MVICDLNLGAIAEDRGRFFVLVISNTGAVPVGLSQYSTFIIVRIVYTIPVVIVKGGKGGSCV